ncbi:MAG: DMT family transporter [Hyphomonadaceae bacterium]|nr:DMT family transporter [Hyphomonadaceae bacterium]
MSAPPIRNAMQVHRTPTDWALFALLSFLWASAFAFTKLAVEGIPTGLIVFGRLATGTLLLAIVMLVRGDKFPPLSNRTAWTTMLAMGTIGTAAPFYLLTTAQQDIDSALAALLISATPLYVAALAHFRFADEQMSWNKGFGILVGFLGVAILLGPDALAGFGNSTLIAQLLALAGGLCYAINTIIARGGPAIAPTVLPTGFLGIAALASLPMALASDYSEFAPGAVEIGAVIGLGALPTAAAGWLLMYVVARTSATFVALTGYAIPIFAAAIGYFLLGEAISWRMALALAMILAGVWLSQRRGGVRPVKPVA